MSSSRVTELNLVDMDLTEVPSSYLSSAASYLTLNLSENRLSPPCNLHHFSKVHTLVLDKNGLKSVSGFAKMLSVTTLWFNNNNVTDIVSFLDDVASTFPNVTYLACMRNPCSPPLAIVSEEDVETTRRFRLYVIYRLPKLQFLDSSPVAQNERKEASVKGQYLAPRRPTGGSTGGGASSPASASSMPTAQQTSPQAAAPVEALKRPSSFLGMGSSRYDGANSEGNRFITDKHL
jgi:hypothetical protein